jgi:hypothetical protein
MAVAIARMRRVHSMKDRCFFCATDKEIATAMSRTRLGEVVARLLRRHPTIHWQGVSCPFEEN